MQRRWRRRGSEGWEKEGRNGGEAKVSIIIHPRNPDSTLQHSRTTPAAVNSGGGNINRPLRQAAAAASLFCCCAVLSGLGLGRDSTLFCCFCSVCVYRSTNGERERESASSIDCLNDAPSLLLICSWISWLGYRPEQVSKDERRTSTRPYPSINVWSLFINPRECECNDDVKNDR